MFAFVISLNNMKSATTGRFGMQDYNVRVKILMPAIWARLNDTKG